VVELLERERELAAVEALLERGGAVLVVEGGSGIGKTSLLEAACRRAGALGHETLRSRGSELEAGFAFGIVRQLFERRLATVEDHEREALLTGGAAAVRALLLGDVVEAPADDTSFVVLHGLYWLAVRLADRRPLLIVVDDAHWADAPSLRWLAHLAPRLEGLALALLVALRPGDPSVTDPSLTALRAEASVLRPGLLSEAAVRAIVRDAGAGASDALCSAVRSATGGNPFYLTELLRAVAVRDLSFDDLGPSELLAAGREAVGRRVLSRARALDPRALGLAQALSALGDGCELRYAAAIAGMEMEDAARLAAGLVRIEVLADDDPPCFIHPVVRDAIEASLPSDERDAAHRAAARLLHADAAPAGQVCAHLTRVRASGDRWAVSRFREAARAAMDGGAPGAAAALLERALVEPPARALRVGVLREAARADTAAGRASACSKLLEALELATDPRERAEIALALAEAYAALFRWVDAVDVVERALSGLGDADDDLAARLEGELVVCGLHDARRASHVAPVLERLSARSPAGTAAEALGVARGMAMVLAGRPADEAAGPSERALALAEGRAENWDTRAALLWSLVTAERFDAVASALRPMVAEVRRSGSARGLVATYSTLGLLELRLGALPEADAAARVALRVLQEGDFGPGLVFAVTVLADVAVEAGELDEAHALLALLPADGWPPGVGTVLIPATRGRVRLAQGRAADALADFQTCADMFSPEVWGREMRDVGYLHARSGAALALLRLGQPDRARAVAQAELADVRAFRARRALGVALRVAGLAHGGDRGLELLDESVDVLRRSRRCWSGRTRWRSMVPRCGARAGAPRPVSRCSRPSTSRPAAGRAPSPRGCAPSSRRPVPARDASGAPVPRRSRRARCASCGSRPTAAPTARSRTSCTSPSRPSRATCRART
jgi:tetratricopeptide (TPR) repeat protein